MIDTIKNNDGYVIAYIEWEIVDGEGQYSRDGEYIYIQNIWVHKQHRLQRLHGELSKKIHEHDFSKQAKYVYWQVSRDMYGNKIIDEYTRSHKSKRMSETFNKEYIYKKIKGEST